MRFSQKLRLFGRSFAKHVSERIVELATEPTIAPGNFEGDSEVIQHDDGSHAPVTLVRGESENGGMVAPVSVFLPGDEEDEYTIITYDFPESAFNSGEEFVGILVDVIDRSLNEEEFDLSDYFERSQLL